MAFYGAMPSLFKRCVRGCPIEQPQCPICPDDQVCSMITPTCDQCARTICVASEGVIEPPPPTSTPRASSSGPNAGAIAGGVIGGLVAIAILTYLVWRLCIKTKRQQYEQDNWGQDVVDDGSTEKVFAMRRDARASTHTVSSIASTVLTRASNIIQIAYIPGVTNRSAPSTPGLLVPPVPPIPIVLSPTGSSPNYEHEHFFMPGDLRDSTCSAFSDRTSNIRNSVASTIYGKNAVVSPVPAQTMIRGKAAVVSVKSNGAGTPGEATPPVPSVDYGRFANNEPASPAFSVGSTFLNNASATTATQVRPQIVRVASIKKSSVSSQEGQSPLARDSNAITIIDDTPSIEQGPFSDRRHSGGTLGAVPEETAQKVQATDAKKTPFGDENEVKEGGETVRGE